MSNGPTLDPRATLKFWAATTITALVTLIYLALLVWDALDEPYAVPLPVHGAFVGVTGGYLTSIGYAVFWKKDG